MTTKTRTLWAFALTPPRPRPSATPLKPAVETA